MNMSENGNTALAVNEDNIIQLNTAVDVSQRTDIVAECESIEIKTQTDVEKSVELERTLKDNKKEIELGFKPVIDKAYQTHRELTAKRNAFLKPIEDAITTIQNKRNRYVAYQERIRKEQEAELARQQKAAEETERLRQAELAEVNGDAEGAEAILSGEAAIHVPTPPAAAMAEPEKVGGLVTKKVYSAACVDKMALVKAIASGRDDLLHLLTIDQSALNKLAAATKENFKVAGCRLETTTRTHTRA